MTLFFNILRYLFTRQLLIMATILLIIFAIIGHIVRDQTIILAFMMYLPLLPLGIWAILLDLLQIGRSIPKFRFGLTVLGLILVIWGSFSMVGTNHFQINLTAHTIRLLHWNTKWGGIGYSNALKKQYQHRNERWTVICQDIYQRRPDIIVLSEPPQFDTWLTQLTQQMGPNWSMLKHHQLKRNHLAILSSWPLQPKGFATVRNGRAMFVTVTIQNRSLHLLLVDGERSVRKLRTALLTDIIRAVIHHGQIDMIIGDFNAVSRSIGFDSYLIAGYQLTSKVARIWRGTWPSILPLYDIDHIWIHKRFQVLKVEMFNNPYTDHRGQQVYFNFDLET